MSAKPEITKALLVGLDISKGHKAWSATDSLRELAELARTAGITETRTLIQSREQPDHNYYVGSGKVFDLLKSVQEHGIQVLIADDELSPLQHKNLEKQLEIKILDRTSLILDIFARRARTYEAQLQVELAQLDYLKPRLTHMWKHLSRLGGGIGTRGPGEKQLEVDRRQIDKRITLLKDKLDKVRKARKTSREKRKVIPMLTGAIVGYTNAGKSTLLNALTNADVLVEDKLFATLDPTTRKIRLPSREMILMTDTVGFIQKLPHQLVSAFRSTLEEVSEAHFILHLVDVSEEKCLAKIATVNALLKELGADVIPQLYVFNKVDQVSDLRIAAERIGDLKPYVFISALKKKNFDEMMATIDALLKKNRKKMTFRVPMNRMDIVHLLHEHGRVIAEEYGEGAKIDVEINRVIGEKIMGQLYK